MRKFIIYALHHVISWRGGGGHAALMGEMVNAYNILVCKPTGKDILLKMLMQIQG
jgi:hypothetical protein